MVFWPSVRVMSVHRYDDTTTWIVDMFASRNLSCYMKRVKDSMQGAFLVSNDKHRFPSLLKPVDTLLLSHMIVNLFADS